jgi:hypothetical protein
MNLIEEYFCGEDPDDVSSGKSSSILLESSANINFFTISDACIDDDDGMTTSEDGGDVSMIEDKIDDAPLIQDYSASVSAAAAITRGTPRTASLPGSALQVASVMPPQTASPPGSALQVTSVMPPQTASPPGKDRFTAVKASYIGNGLATRRHGNSFRTMHSLSRRRPTSSPSCTTMLRPMQSCYLVVSLGIRGMTLCYYRHVQARGVSGWSM